MRRKGIPNKHIDACSIGLSLWERASICKRRYEGAESARGVLRIQIVLRTPNAAERSINGAVNASLCGIIGQILLRKAFDLSTIWACYANPNSAGVVHCGIKGEKKEINNEKEVMQNY